MASFNVMPYVNKALPEALEVVRSIVSSHPTPLRIKEIYELALKEPLDGTVQHILRPQPGDSQSVTLPPHPQHPIRSMSYLKRVVLPVLDREGFIKKVHTLREMTQEERATRRDSLPKSARKAAEQGMTHEWLWQRKGPMPVQKPEPPRTVDIKELVFGGDISHLSKRRQRSRQETSARELEWVNELEKARKEGARRAKAVAK